MKYLVPLMLTILSGLSTEAPAQTVWTTAELQSNCIPAGVAGLRARTPECTVREFGKLTELAGKETWYALYSNFPEPLAEAARGSPLDFPNVLVLFEAANGSDRLTPFRVGNPEGSFYRQFDAPLIISTAFGSVLYVRGYGAGDGRSQFEYDQFLLWRDSAWVELDALEWIPEVRARLPSGYQLDGIHKDGFDLGSLRYQGPVRRPEDCHNCATGGTVDVTLELQQDSLRVKDFLYSPGGL